MKILEVIDPYLAKLPGIVIALVIVALFIGSFGILDTLLIAGLFGGAIAVIAGIVWISEEAKKRMAKRNKEKSL